MRLLINTASTYQGGGVQVALSFIEECIKYPENEYYVILGKKLSDLVNRKDFPSNFTFEVLNYRPATRIQRFRMPDTELKKMEKAINPDVVFTTSGPAYWRPGAPHLVGYNLPHYIYKDSPFFGKISFQKRIKWFLKGAVIKYFFNRDSDAFVVQTDDVNRRLRNWLRGKKVFTVSNTYNRYYERTSHSEHKLPCKKEGEFRLLSLTAWHTHKNLEVIPTIIQYLPTEYSKRVKFVLTLPEDTFQEYFSRELQENIVNIGPVEPFEGPALYKECDATFLPTLLECFSANYPESMKMGRPILTSDLSFAHSICGEAALYANPLDPHEIAKRIIEMIENPMLLQQLVNAGQLQLKNFLTPEQRAREYLQICKTLIHERENSR